MQKSLVAMKSKQSTRSRNTQVTAVFYYNGKNFCIRGGDEHRNLRVSQLQRFSNPDRYVYNEYVSKNHLRTFTKHHISSNIVPIYCQCSQSTCKRCHVYLLDLRIHKQATTRSKTSFTLVLMNWYPKAPWYSAVLVGRTTLSTK